jgi:CheY-like chemotaxis protein
MRRKKFDIVLADIMMLGMTGYDMAERIREFNKTVPIIALTANAQETEKEKSIACGMAAHITKPIDSKLMLETIKKFAL